MELTGGAEISPHYLTYLEAGEVPTFGTWLSLAVVNGQEWKIPLLLLTDRRFIISKKRIVGKPRADLALPWANVSTIGSGTISPAFIELIVSTTRGPIPIHVLPQHAADVEGAIRTGYLSNPAHPAHRRG
jgi:hypothetical protein